MTYVKTSNTIQCSGGYVYFEAGTLAYVTGTCGTGVSVDVVCARTIGFRFEQQWEWQARCVR